jgi:hypothetical protein
MRRDWTVLATIFVFAALINAFAMTTPGVAVERSLAAAVSTTFEWPALAALFALGLALVPLLLLGGAAAVARLAGPSKRSWGSLVGRYAYALVPFGVGAWVAHYGFHFLTGALTVVPVTQSALIDLTGRPELGEPLWRWSGLRPGAVFPIQLGFLLLGTIGSLGVARGIAAHDEPGRPWRAAAPWLAIILLLACAAAWVLAQPMEMRGTGFAG